ncbi:patatin-related protein [Streptoalloteichus hindustanus]|uniref:Patatin-related protein n=2 Tax=Streptoalloteichus hindustanus TaxID=2017 RepID=A0A1M5J3S1_STRHI|nr:patatin-related protein [Streptoalloteichus hindustanus]
MRGGVSLAVWIGGAVAEVDRLRSTTNQDPDHPWAALARLAGYDSVSVDVLTGASAGGLNGTLLAASLVYGFPFTDTRDVWVRLADLEAMCRPVPGLVSLRPFRLLPRPQSVLEGDDYFQAQLARELGRLTAGGPRRPSADRLDLLLTATLMDAVPVLCRDDRLGAIHEWRRTAWFRFRHRGAPGDPLSHFASLADAGPTLRRLALAGRSTSSFPMAFEPATVFSRPDPPDGNPDMRGVFSETAPSGGSPFGVIDGGVLDNIPVSAAVRAVAAAPADGPTERWLLYLNPDPSVGETGGTPATPLTISALPTALRAVTTRFTQESLLADITELEAHNREVRWFELRAEAIYAPLAAAGPADRPARLAELAAQVRPEHARVLAGTVAEKVFRALTEPRVRQHGLLGDPPPGDVLAGWAPHVRAMLAGRLDEHLVRHAGQHPERTFDDLSALDAAVELCVRWARELERWVRAPALAKVGAVKADLYRVRQVLSVLEENVEHHWLESAISRPVTDPARLSEWIDGAAREAERRQHALAASVGAALDAVLVGGGEDFQRRLVALADALSAESEELSTVDESGGVDAVAVVREAVHRLVDRLADAAPPRRATEPVIARQIDPGSRPELVGHVMLEEAEPARRPEVLAGLVVLTVPLRIGEVSNGRIAFLRVASDAETSLPFRALRGDADRLTPEEKLCGVDMGNFAAFCSGAWRANDWMWGRLDAVTSLVALLTDPDRLRRFHSGRDVDDLLSEIATIATSPPTPGELGAVAVSRDDADEWRQFLTERWDERVDAVRAELVNLLAETGPAQPPAFPLTALRAALVERLHWGIAAVEIPFVRELVCRTGDDSDPPPQPVPPAPGRLVEDVARYDVGRQKVRDLGETRVTRMAMRLGMVAYRSLRPRSSRPAALGIRATMTALRPLWLMLLFAVAAPERLLFTLGLSVGTWLCAQWSSVDGGRTWSRLPLVSELGQTRWDVPRTLLAVVAALCVVVSLSASWSRLTRRPPAHCPRRPVVFPLLAVVLVVGGFVAALFGVLLGPLAVTLSALLATWVGTFWMRPLARLTTTVLAVVCYLGGAMLFADLGLPIGWWLVAATAASWYVVAVLTAVVDVLPRVPGRGTALRPTAAR